MSWQSKAVSILRILEGQIMLFPIKSKQWKFSHEGGVFLHEGGVFLHEGAHLPRKISSLARVLSFGNVVFFSHLLLPL